jgi:hypothetical protein
VKRAISFSCALPVSCALLLGCALLAGALVACQQTVVLDDRPPDAGGQGTGGTRGDGGGKGGFNPTDASTDALCSGNQAQLLEAIPDVPQVIVTLDRSLMTTETPLGPQDEFSTAAADLSTEVSHYQSSSGPSHTGSGIAISFSYLAFPSTTAGCDYPLGCCTSDATYTPTSSAFQMAAYSCSQPGTCVSSNNRPIAAALAAAHDTFMQAGSSAGPRFVLLVSGGPPSGGCSSNDCQSAINRIDDLNSQQVTTYVVGMGDQTNDGCLQSIANEVGSTSMFYTPAASSNDLAHALEAVTGSIAQAACHMTLVTTFSNVSPSQLAVYEQGNSVMQDDRNGWTLESQNTRLVLHGSACTNFTLGGGIYGLQVYTGCTGHFGGNP